MYFDLEATQGAVEVFIGCFIAVEVISSITSFFLKQINNEDLKVHLYFWKNNEFINKTGKISSLLTRVPNQIWQPPWFAVLVIEEKI